MEPDRRSSRYMPYEHLPRHNHIGMHSESRREALVSGDTSQVVHQLARQLDSRDGARWNIPASIISNHEEDRTAAPQPAHRHTGGASLIESGGRTNIADPRENQYVVLGEALGQRTLTTVPHGRLPAQRPGDVLVNLSAADLELFEEFRASRSQARQRDYYTAYQIVEDHDPFPRRGSLFFNGNASRGPTSRFSQTEAHGRMEAPAPSPFLQRDSSRPEQRRVSQPLVQDEPRNINRCMEDKSGSGICDWCDRPGHEAIDCIRWDPVYFDKGVCVLCNNRLHGIDECIRFEDLDLIDQAELLVDIGRMKPGVRSVAEPWVCIALPFFLSGRGVCLHDPTSPLPCLVTYHTKADHRYHQTSFCRPEYYDGIGLPMTRDYVRRLDGDQSGRDWKNLWRVWDYDDQLPDKFNDKEFDTVEKIQQAEKNESCFATVYKPC